MKSMLPTFIQNENPNPISPLTTELANNNDKPLLLQPHQPSSEIYPNDLVYDAVNLLDVLWVYDAVNDRFQKEKSYILFRNGYKIIVEYKVQVFLFMDVKIVREFRLYSSSASIGEWPI